MNIIGPFPPGGKGGLRKMLEAMRESDEELKSNPLYKEGYDDGYAAAEENCRKLYTALSAVYQINSGREPE